MYLRQTALLAMLKPAALTASGNRQITDAAEERERNDQAAAGRACWVSLGLPGRDEHYEKAR